jgi:hypothetical protein
MAENICWRGPPGSGKRLALHRALQQKAEQRGLLLKISKKIWSLEKPKETDDSEGDDDEKAISKDQIPFESSILHFGFDVSRMSLQDRHILKPILERLGKGSHVLAGKERAEARILVFYHAHLLSTESCVILQSILEQDGQDISIWVTSEHPMPIRVAHHFREIPVGGPDLALQTMRKRIEDVGGTPAELFDPQELFDRATRRLCRPGPPVLEEVEGLRAFIYECLIRNIRWIECVHHFMVSLLRLPIPDKYRLAGLRILAKQEGSASGQTIPSYRIPMAWESLFIQMREALSGALVDEDRLPPSVTRTVVPNSRTDSKKTTTTVDSGKTKRGGSTVAKGRGGSRAKV